MPRPERPRRETAPNAHPPPKPASLAQPLLAARISCTPVLVGMRAHVQPPTRVWFCGCPTRRLYGWVSFFLIISPMNNSPPIRETLPRTRLPLLPYSLGTPLHLPVLRRGNLHGPGRLHPPPNVHRRLRSVLPAHPDRLRPGRRFPNPFRSPHPRIIPPAPAVARPGPSRRPSWNRHTRSLVLRRQFSLLFSTFSCCLF